MTPQEHYKEAERLLAAGQHVVDRIAELPHGNEHRDGLGKQAMGIWAQAQVHAMLANCRPTINAYYGEAK